MDRRAASHLANILYRPVLAICLLIVLTVSVGGCQTAKQTTPSLSTTDTADAAHDFGSLVVGLQGGVIWSLVEEESPRLLTQGVSPQISPDGRLVVVGRPTGTPSYSPAYWLVNTSDQTEKLLLPAASAEGMANVCLVYDLAWSPDSSHIAYTCGGALKTFYTGDLWLMDVSNDMVTQIAGGNAGEPHFSPNGEWVATAMPQTEYNRGTLALWHVESKRSLVLFSQLYRPYLEWADDSSGFAAAFQRSGEASLELWWIPVDATPVQLGRLSDGRYAAWQPNTERLVYYSPLSLYGPRSSYRLHLVNRDGSRDKVIPGSKGLLFWESQQHMDQDWQSPWSPDGHWLLIMDQERTYIADTYNLHAPIPLSVDRVYGWADATHYLASTYRESVSELYLCTPPEECEPLAQFEGAIQSLSYTEQVYRP